MAPRTGAPHTGERRKGAVISTLMMVHFTGILPGLTLFVPPYLSVTQIFDFLLIYLSVHGSPGHPLAVKGQAQSRKAAARAVGYRPPHQSA